MSQQIPQPPSSSRNSSKVIAALLIGLLVGLGIGVVIGYEILPTHNGAGTNNQVQVSGTITNTDQYVQITFTQISFVNLNQTISSSAQISANGTYSILLVNGQSYIVQIEDSGGDSSTASLYIPTGVTTFTHNFSVDFNF